ncbi:Nucleoporin NUP84 [Golovinomyces cichoracearum]|uniref:Nuclear pore complex protein n=1 Tax=Golovinomyces cichoracearum TaxID=62708 RepID=A0A420HHP1_9PEZI|nr:Nucleoporin NUP84 [Golovinomyces cichoracearum]
MAPMTRNNISTPRVYSSRGFAVSESQTEERLSEGPDWPLADDCEMNDEIQDDGFELDNEYNLKDMFLRGPEDEDDVLHPLREAANRVGSEVEEFARILDNFSLQRISDQNEKNEATFELIGQFRNVALKTVDRLKEKHASERRKTEGRKWRKKMRGFKILHGDDSDVENSDEFPSVDTESSTTAEDLERWEQEAQTWDLLKRLALVRFGNRPQVRRPFHQYFSKKELYEHFFATEDLALDRRTVLEWLKDTAEESGEELDVIVEDLQQSAERGDIIAHGWLHTKAAIKDHKRRIGSSHALDPKAPEVDKLLLNIAKTEPLSTQLDPDAPSRQGRKLATQDQYFERAIWLGCYELLRRGSSSEKISEWCMERTEVWRSVSMLGISFETLKETSESADPDAMIRWRKMCLSLIRSNNGTEYEKAVYGILSGDISSVEPVCKSWDDFMFVHYNALLRTQFDKYLKKLLLQSTSMKPPIHLEKSSPLQTHSESRAEASRLISSLMSNPRIGKETTKPMKVLQGVLIADKFAHFIFQQGIVLSRIANSKEVSRVIPPSKHQLEDTDLAKYITLDDHDSLRVITHVLLIFMGLGLDLGGVYCETEVQNVIVAYISFLKLAAKEELIPLYCSLLSGTRRYSTLSRNLIDVTEEDQRVTQLKLMRELGLDTREFVSLQARYLLDDFPDLTSDYPALGNFRLFSDSSDTSSSCRTLKKNFISEKNSMERADLLLIRSLQWYLLVDGLWVEAFRFGTLLYLRFFSKNKKFKFMCTCLPYLEHMNLHAAKMLSINVPSKTLMEQKTRHILGESINLYESYPIDEGSSTDALKAHMLSEASNFRELEILIECLDSINTASYLAKTRKRGPSSQESATISKDWRNYQTACKEAHSCAGYLLKDWLLKTPNENIRDQLILIRQAYLPETILAYITTLQIAGILLSREFLLKAMEVSSILAAEGSDTLDILVKTGYLKEIVDNLARASKSLLDCWSNRKSMKTTSPRLERNKRKLKLWNVKLNDEEADHDSAK